MKLGMFGISKILVLNHITVWRYVFFGYTESTEIFYIENIGIFSYSVFQIFLVFSIPIPDISDLYRTSLIKTIG